MWRVGLVGWVETRTRDGRVIGIPGDDSSGGVAADRALDLADPVVVLERPGVTPVEVGDPVHFRVEDMQAEVDPADELASGIEQRIQRASSAVVV